ncbi:MAG: hypothetical protein K0R55_292 [Sporomusa sp.]|jgi:hypothetical protein|nr:hypothetical protein [Sporomusa sp.]
MCGMNWYRQQLEMAEDDIDRLSKLLEMMQERYKLPLLEPCDKDRVHPDIAAVYQEISSRKKLLLTSKSPQV